MWLFATITSPTAHPPFWMFPKHRWHKSFQFVLKKADIYMWNISLLEIRKHLNIFHCWTLVRIFNQMSRTIWTLINSLLPKWVKSERLYFYTFPKCVQIHVRAYKIQKKLFYMRCWWPLDFHNGFGYYSIREAFQFWIT